MKVSIYAALVALVVLGVVVEDVIGQGGNVKKSEHRIRGNGRRGGGRRGGGRRGGRRGGRGGRGGGGRVVRTTRQPPTLRKYSFIQVLGWLTVRFMLDYFLYHPSPVIVFFLLLEARGRLNSTFFLKTPIVSKSR